MIKKIICLVATFLLLFSLTACEEVEDQEFLKEFDLTEPKEYWTGTIDDNFSDDRVLVCMRKTTTFPELELHHFELDNAESLEYLMLRPPEDYENPSGYTQIAVITLKEHGKDKVVDAIKHLEKLPFIKLASPNHIMIGPPLMITVDYTVGLIDNDASFEEQGLEEIVNTFSEWSSISDERADLSQMDDKYVESFFDDNSLVVYAFTKGSNITQIEINSLKKSGSVLLLKVDISLGIREEMSKGIVILEVAKADIEHITNLYVS